MKDSFNRKETSSQQQVFGFFIILISIITLLSSLLINPWIGKFWRPNIIDYYYEMIEYLVWSSTLGILILITGLLVLKKRNQIVNNITLLIVTISLLLLFDRALLVKFGKPIVVVNPKTIYSYRPNTIKRWGSEHPEPDKIVRINKYGFHDDNFPIKKPDYELRGVTVGNSITMGFAVTSSETYANQLENLLKKYDRRYNSYQIINSGVQGYSIYQEYQMLKECMKFEPDFVTIGFCMNDINAPAILNRLLGGKDIEEYGIMKTKNPIFSYLLNETGFGRLFIMLRREVKLEESTEIRKQFIRKYKAWLNYKEEGVDIEKAWEYVLSDLEEFYNFTEENNLKCILLIFPDAYQLFNEQLRRPQVVLKSHIEKYNVDIIDFSEVFASIIMYNISVKDSREESKRIADEIQMLIIEQIDKYFIDGHHPTPEGHRIIAIKLLEYLNNVGLIELSIQGGVKIE